MATIILILHLMIALGLVGVVLLQRSEGGGLGIGGGGSGGFMTGRGTANFLTRVTAGLAAAFFVTSLSLTLLAQQSTKSVSPLDAPTSQQGGILKKLEDGKAPLPKSQ
jgi:preprotein translocase subunit SecG